MIAIWMRKGLIWKWNKWDLSLALPYLHRWETFVKRLENKHFQQESEFLWKKYVYCRSLMKVRFSTALMTWYHQVSTITALYWSGTTKYQQVLTQYHQIWTSTKKYQPVPTYTDPVPSCINQYRLLLTQYHQVPTATAFYWPSTIIYQPVPLHTDPVPPSINQYQPILLLLGDYRLLHSLPWVLSSDVLYFFTCPFPFCHGLFYT